MDFPFTSTITTSTTFSSQYETCQNPFSFTQFPLQNVVIPPLVPQQDHLVSDEMSRRRKVSSLLLDDENNGGINHNDPKKKQKIVHRDIERQRRSEMSSLHASLRSLLPLDYIKGKRAMSDHLGEAVKYIRDLQENIKALNDQRDSIKKEVCIKDNSKSNDREVKVKSCKGGVDVSVSTSCEINEGIPLSKVLKCLIQEGFDVVSCISHRVDDNSKFIHCIQAQVEDGKIITIDAIKLQKKLEDL